MEPTRADLDKVEGIDYPAYPPPPVPPPARRYRKVQGGGGIYLSSYELALSNIMYGKS